MRLLDKVRLRLRSLFRRGRVEQDLAREFAFHLDQQVQANIAQGMSPAEARAAALRTIGGIAQLQEECRDMRRVNYIDELLVDLRYAARGLRKSPGFAVIAILTLALGIGASTALFSLVHTVLLRPLPFGDPDRLAMIWESIPEFPRNNPAPANFLDWKAQSQAFADMAAAAQQDYNLTGEGEAERLLGWRTTANFLNLLKIVPALGRFPSPAEDNPESAPVAVISHDLWQRRFDGNTNVLGRSIRLNNVSFTIIGVAPPGFQFPLKGAAVWVSPGFSGTELVQRGNHYLYVVGRMKAGVSHSQASADINTVAKRLETQYPDNNKNVAARVVTLREHYAGDVRLSLNLLLAAVGALLLIACSNIAHLLLARGMSRGREIAMRVALGAGRSRVIRQMLTESILLAGSGAVFGAVLAAASFRFLSRLIPGAFPEGTALGFNPSVLVAAAGLAVLAGMISGLGPAFTSTRLDLNHALKQSAGRNTTSAQGRLRAILIVAEMTLTVVLLIAAGLLLTSYARLRGVDTGFRPEALLTLDMPLSPGKYAAPEKRSAFFQDVLTRVKRLPNVVSAGFVNFPPLTMKGGSNGFIIEGRSAPPPGQGPVSNNRASTSEYLRTLGVPLLRGRYFDDQEGVQSPRVIVINQAMADANWPGEDPVGKRIHFFGPDPPWYTIVGVVGNVKQMGLDVPTRPEMYFPAQASVGGSFFWPRTLVVRTKSEPTALAPDLRRIVAAVDPDQPVAKIQTMEQVLDTETASQQTQTALLSSFAIIALMLASIGLYGVLSYSVAQRTPEIGLRMALGAQRREVIVSVVRRALFLTATGIGVGLAAAFMLTRAFASMLFQVSPTDPITFTLVTVTLLGVAVAASYVPARRAASIDPVIALRNE